MVTPKLTFCDFTSSRQAKKTYIASFDFHYYTACNSPGTKLSSFCQQNKTGPKHFQNLLPGLHNLANAGTSILREQGGGSNV